MRFVLYVYRKKCKPCSEFIDKLNLVVGENPELILIKENIKDINSSKIKIFPTTILIDNDVELGRLVGNVSIEEIRKFLTQ